MFDEAIKALIDNDPELAIHLIRTVVTAHLRVNEEPFELVESVANEMVSTTDFLKFNGEWELSR